ncbi:molybdate ABC transporter substrate-binding protein [Reichenbachiella sp. 5M10]|nr:molybdate ABC transporter substrate-binding protein [Reichenbachiella sp. 5M10]
MSFFFLVSTTALSQPVRVAAASSMADFLAEVKTIYESKKGIPVEIITNSSGALTNQIMNGAPYDLFLSANTKYTQQLHHRNIRSFPPSTFAYNQLVIWSKTPLTDPQHYILSSECHTIGLAQPELAPFGALAIQYLDSLEVTSLVQEKLVFGNNISITNQFIYTQNVDLAFTSKSSVLKLQSQVACCWTDIPTALLPVIPQSALPLNQTGQSFLLFLTTDPDTANILAKYGYLPAH